MNIEKEYSQDKIFLHMDRIGEYMKGKNVVPIVMETNVTNKCNANCRWCSEMGYRTNHIQDEMDREVMLKFIKDASRMGVKSFVFEGGGEPTVHPDLIEFVQTTVDSGADAGLITNGMLLKRAKIIDNVELFKFVRISFDAGNPDVYASGHGVNSVWYEFIWKQVEQLVKYRNKKFAKTVIGMSFIVMEDNLPTAREFARRAKEVGVDYVQFKAEIYNNSFRIPFGAKEQISEIHRDFEDDSFRVFVVRLDGDNTCFGKKDYTYCFAHRFIGAMTANGNVQLCCNLKHEFDDRYSLGNLYEETFEEIWNGERRKKMISGPEESPDFVRTHCGQCRMDSINRTFNWVQQYNPDMKNFI